METLFRILDFVLFTWFSFTVIYMLFYAILSVFYKDKLQFNKDQKFTKILILIPAYKEEKVILKTLQAIVNQDYNKNFYRIVLIADHFNEDTLKKTKCFPIDVLDVSFENSTKSKAINYALSIQTKNYDLVTILDADNIVETNFLAELNLNFQNGKRAIQGQRIAKNANTSFATLDAISEEINNSIFCKGQQVLGFTSRLTGSGMAFEFELFKGLMANINAIGGFDKELELLLLQNNVSIFYNPKIKIFDEKVAKSKVLMNQRSRWISAQFHYMNKFGVAGLSEFIKKGNLEFFNKYLQLFLLPKMLLVVFLLLGLFIQLLILKEPHVFPWILCASIFVSIYLIIFPKKYLKINLLKMLYVIPFTIIKMFFRLPKLYTANKQFIHTPHES